MRFSSGTIEDPRGRGAVRARRIAKVRTNPVYLQIVEERLLRALRANLDFCADEKRIRTEIKVMNKSKGSAGVSYKILARARKCFSSVHKRGSARTASRPRNMKSLRQR